MLALVCPMEDADRDVAADPPPEDLVLALARLAASAPWDVEVDGRARAIVAGLYRASVSGDPSAAHGGASADPVA